MSNVIEIRRKSPLRAVKFTGDNFREVLEFTGGEIVQRFFLSEELIQHNYLKHGATDTESGEIMLIKDDYVFFDEKGELYSCSDDTMEKHFELIERRNNEKTRI